MTYATHSNRSIAAILLGLLLMLWGPPSAAAVDFCVNSVSGLRSALQQFKTAVGGTNYDITIGLVQGTYSVGNTLGLFDTQGSNIDLRLLGGYTAGCNNRVVDPRNTILDGGNAAGSWLSLSTHADSVLLIEGVTFQHFDAGEDRSVLTLSGQYDTFSSSQGIGVYALKYCRFINNKAGFRIADVEGIQSKIVNNLFARNQVDPSGSSTPDATIGVQYNMPSEAVDPFTIFINNTLAFNSGAPGLTIVSSYLNDDISSDRVTEIADNIVVGSSGADLNFSNYYLGNTTLIHSNLLFSHNYPLPLDASNLIGVDPQFVDAANDDFRLKTTSAAANSGSLYQRYGFPAHDLFNQARVVGSAIDRGAFETSLNNLTTALVTVSGDNGNNAAPLAGSLRAAMVAANNASGPFTIRFNVPGTCPRTLTVTAPLPDVTGQVIVDGRSQPGWSPNTAFGQFDANLCLFINGNGGTSTPWAFHVPANANNAALTVRDLVMTGFSDAAIKIEDGSNHHIQGNQFGAVAFTLPNRNAVRLLGDAGTTYVGGFDEPSTVNLIAGTSDAGVYVGSTAGGSVIANNVLGFGTDGTSDIGNANGIVIVNSPNNYVAYNVIGHSSNVGIWLTGTQTTANELQSNVIGATISREPAGNVTAGVLVSSGAHGNTIGAPIGVSYGQNVIDANSGPGVWMAPSAGVGNRVLHNSSFGNFGIDIDLGNEGASINQPSNPSTGPNNLQNYPVLSAAQRTPGNPPQVTVTGQLLSRSFAEFQIDFYVGDCSATANARGEATLYLGRTTVITGLTGHAPISATFPAVTGPLYAVSATATALGTGDTSEIGNCVNETSVFVLDRVFSDSFE